MKKINLLIGIFIIFSQTYIFSDNKYSFDKISEKYFEEEFDDKEKIRQIIEEYFERERIENKLYPIELVYSINSYHKLDISHNGTIIFIEFSQDLFPLTRNYILELHYNSLGNFLNYNIICFDEPPKQEKYFPIEIQK